MSYVHYQLFPCDIIKLYILTYMHRNKQKCSLFMNLKMTVVFMTNVWLNIGLHVKVCFQFFICVLTVYLVSKWMLLGFGRGYNNQVTVAFCSSDVTKHVSWWQVPFYYPEKWLTFSRVPQDKTVMKDKCIMK